MNSQPSPEEAAEALRTVSQGRERALTSGQREARWLDVVAGVILFLYSASVDFFPQSAPWRDIGLAVLVVGYVALLRTRRGSALLGQHARLSRRDVWPRFAVGVWLVGGLLVAGSMVAVFVLGRTGTSIHVPYLSTALGAVMAIVLIAFGPQLRAGMNRLARRRSGTGDVRP
ncbi:hypothetical protein [Amycolatopsis pigmentata]|uniref:Uncharacterized protein n=1 Tax=Amycolatopsis pigmentata TaxID=450801 RepID=A0ABW5G0H4_9PSEU